MTGSIAPPHGSVRPVFGNSLPRHTGTFIELYQAVGEER